MKSGLHPLKDQDFSFQAVAVAAGEAHHGRLGGSPWESEPSDSRYKTFKLKKMSEKWIASGLHLLKTHACHTLNTQMER